MKVLFLDIDGVLNSERTRVAFKGLPHDLTPEHLAMFDPVALNMIRGLCHRGDVSVVVSSAWRTTHSWDAIGRALGLPTMGRTPSLMGCRGEEIDAWLRERPEVDTWAILDDSSDMLSHQWPRFVHVNGFEGLSWADFVKLCGLFGLAPYDCAPSRVRRAGVVHLTWDDAL